MPLLLQSQRLVIGLYSLIDLELHIQLPLRKFAQNFLVLSSKLFRSLLHLLLPLLSYPGLHFISLKQAQIFGLILFTSTRFGKCFIIKIYDSILVEDAVRLLTLYETGCQVELSAIEYFHRHLGSVVDISLHLCNLFDHIHSVHNLTKNYMFVV